jgi:type I restriction enzyme S subunit
MRLLTREETPQDWNSKTISYYVEKHKGGAPLRPTDFSDIGFPVIPKKAIQAGNKLIINNPTYCTNEFAKNNERSVVDYSFTITTLRDLVPTGPTIGTVVNYYTDEKYILSQGVYGLKFKTSIDRNYFAYMSNTSFYRKVMCRVMVGSTQVHIRTPEYLNIEIQTPPLSEQRKIAKILGTWDKAISTTEALIDNSKQQKKALMQQLLTGNLRLLDDAGKAFKGEWEEVKLEGLLLEFVNGNAFTASNYKKSGIPIITMGNIGLDGSFNERESKANYWDESTTLEKFIICKGCLIIAMTDVTPNKNLIGRMTIVDVNKIFYLNQRVGLLKLKAAVDAHFLKYLSNELQWRKYSISVSASGVQANMSTKDIKQGKLLLPCFEEQQKIASVLANADKEIELLKQQLADLKQEKKALMQQLLTGKRRVKVDELLVA